MRKANVVVYGIVILLGATTAGSFAAYASEKRAHPVASHSSKSGPIESPDMAETGPSLNADDEFEVESYDPGTRTYKLILLDDETAGPLVASPEDLGKSVEAIDLAAILRAPYSIVKLQYTVDDNKELRLLTDEEIAARRKKKKN